MNALAKKRTIFLSRIIAVIMSAVVLVTMVGCQLTNSDGDISTTPGNPTYDYSNVNLGGNSASDTFDSRTTGPDIIFSDEFDAGELNKGIIVNGKKVNQTVWSISDTTWIDGIDTKIRRGMYWDESQISFRDKSLVITTEKKEDGNYYSAAINSGGANGTEGFSQKQGYFEARCKIPAGEAIWSAFWLMSPSLGAENPDASLYGAELDIMESPWVEKPYVEQVIHAGGYGANIKSMSNKNVFNQPIADKHGAFHTYGLYWDENIYKFYVDRQCVWTTSFNNNVSQIAEYLFLSVETYGDAPKFNATTGKWEPTPVQKFHYKSITDNIGGWKGEFIVDYVKIWKTGYAANFLNNNHPNMYTS